jgi:hypothetical protein
VVVVGNVSATFEVDLGEEGAGAVVAAAIGVDDAVGDDGAGDALTTP